MSTLIHQQLLPGSTQTSTINRITYALAKKLASGQTMNKSIRTQRIRYMVLSLSISLSATAVETIGTSVFMAERNVGAMGLNY